MPKSPGSPKKPITGKVSGPKKNTTTKDQPSAITRSKPGKAYTGGKRGGR